MQDVVQGRKEQDLLAKERFTTVSERCTISSWFFTFSALLNIYTMPRSLIHGQGTRLRCCSFWCFGVHVERLSRSARNRPASARGHCQGPSTLNEQSIPVCSCQEGLVFFEEDQLCWHCAIVLEHQNVRLSSCFARLSWKTNTLWADFLYTAAMLRYSPPYNGPLDDRCLREAFQAELGVVVNWSVYPATFPFHPSSRCSKPLCH